jgi:hypothetical protein
MKKSQLKVLFFTLLSALSLNALSGALVNVKYETDIQFFQTNGEITGCGIGFVGIEDVGDQSQQVRLVSGSMVLSSSEVGVTKVAMTTFKHDPSIKQHPPAPLSQVTDYWMRRTGGKIVTSANKKVTPSVGNKNSVLQVISADDLAELFKSINSNDEFQVGVTAKNEKNELIFSGKLKVSDKDSDRLEDCLTGLKSSRPQSRP